MTRWIHNSTPRYQWAIVAGLVILLSILVGVVS